MSDRSFFKELRRRKVFQAAAIYGAVAWGVTEVLVTVVEQLFLPQWVSTLAVIGFVVGFPVAMFLAWTFDITAKGIRRTTITSRRGRLSVVLSMVLLVSATAGLFFLIRPALQTAETSARPAPILSNSIAVLTFENDGLDPGDSYLSEGLSDELRDQLGRVEGLRMAARSSSKAAAEQRLDALEASSRLGVANIIEGSIRRQGGMLRVSVQLIEGSSGLAVWSETFDRGPNELLLVQQEIAEALILHLLPGAQNTTPEPATRDPTANELLLLARHHEQRVRERPEVDLDLLREAVRLYREATAADPGSALAHSRLAGALLYLGDVDAAGAPIFKALSINPNLSEVQNTLGEYYWARGLDNEAGAAWSLAIDLNPNNPEVLPNYAAWSWKRIQVESARELYQRALELDRLNLERYAELGSFLALQNFMEEAHELVREVEGMFDGVAASRVIGQLWAYLGDVDKAIAWTIRARDLEPDNGAHVDKLAEFYADIGDFDTALALAPDHPGILFKMRRYEKMIDLAEFAMIDQPQNLRLLSILAIAYNALGRYESAIRILSRTGLPDSVINGGRSTEEWDGFSALMNALYGAGEIELARQLAQFAVDFGKWETFYWWINVPAACELAVLGRDDEARAFLELASQSVQLAWDPILKDSPCFIRFAGDSVYQATVHHFDERRAMLRERLPATLAEFGVEL